MSEKVVGYLLLVIGLFTIIYSGFSVYQVYSGKSQPVALFNLKSITYNPSTAQITLPEMELFSSTAVNQFSNIAAHLILMSFLASLGFKISTLGVQLLRPIEVKLLDKQH